MDIAAEAAKKSLRLGRTEDGKYKFVAQAGPDTWVTYFVGDLEESEAMLSDPLPPLGGPVSLSYNQYRAKQIEERTPYTIIVEGVSDCRASLRVVDDRGIEHTIASSTTHGDIEGRLQEIERGRPLNEI